MGLMVPSGIREKLRSWAHTIEAGLPSDHDSKPDWNDPADLHCTLLFIGESEDQDHLVQQMTQLARKLPPVCLSIAGETHWLGRNSLALPLIGAQHTGTAFVDQLGHLTSDPRVRRRPFHGHVTLGRVRPVPTADNDHFAGNPVPPVTWRADQVQLVRSRDADTGPRYEVVAQAPFRFRRA